MTYTVAWMAGILSVLQIIAKLNTNKITDESIARIHGISFYNQQGGDIVRFSTLTKLRAKTMKLFRLIKSKDKIGGLPMKNPTICLRLTIALACCLLLADASAHQPAVSYDEQVFEADGNSWHLIVPAGYRLELLVEMAKPRMLAKTDNNVLLAGSSAGRLYRIKPPYNQVEVLAALSGFPHSVAVRDGELLVGRTDGIYRVPYQAYRGKLLKNSDFELVVALPSGMGHASRTIAVGPDNKIYVSLGISGNCSDQYIGAGYSFDKQRGGILVLAEQKGRAPQLQPYASGLRNPVGFDWHPNGVLYASNNGPDHQGYELPPEYFSRVESGSFHGMPWFWLNEKNQLVRDDCISSPPPRRDAVLPVATFPARSAPMGVRFVPPGALQPEMVGSATVALHGSWGTKPSGGYFGDKATRRPPQIVLVRFDKDRVLDVVPLLDGLQDVEGRRLARPMDVAFVSDGALYFTSDGGAIEGLFRLRRKN